MGGVDHFVGWVWEWRGLGCGVANTMPLFYSCLCSSLSTAVGSKTVHFCVHWGQLGCVGHEWGTGIDQGVSTGIDDAVSDMAGVWDAGGDRDDMAVMVDT
jgi:hypothetical protein